MNKTEYLNALKEALKDTDESVMEEIVTDYEEHFRMGLENGKTEEEICNELGSIDDLVEEIKEVYNTNKNSSNEKSDGNSRNNEDTQENRTNDDQDNGKNIFKDWYIHLNNLDSEKIGEAINSALDSAGDAISKIDVNEIGRTIKSTLEQATSTINNFADSYLKNQGMGPFDFNKKHGEGYTENVSKSYDASEEPEDTVKSTDQADVSYDTKEQTQVVQENKETVTSEEVPLEEEIKEETLEGETKTDIQNEADEKAKKNNCLNLVVDGICADIYLDKSTNGKLNIYYENNGNDRQKQMYEFYSYKEGNTVYAGIRRIGKTVFMLNLKLYSIRIYVEIPENMGDITLRTASGNIRLTNVNAENLMANAASGDIKIDGGYATELRLKASSGDISLEDVRSNRVRAEASSGDIEANNVEAKFVSLRSSSGDIEVRNINADVVDCSPLSGDLDIDGLKASECKVRSSSGDIKINDFNMNNADVSSISGDIDMSQVVGDGLRTTSGSGDISAEVNVKRCHASSKSGDVDIKCNGDIALESNSTSGNINITLKNYNNGYNITSKTTSGSLYIDYDKIHQRNQKSGNYTYGNQGSELIISTVSGDIHLTD